MANQRRVPVSNNNHHAAEKVAPPLIVDEEQLRDRANRYRQGVMELRSRRDEIKKELEQTELALARTEGALEGIFDLLNPQQGRGMQMEEMQASEA